MNSQQDLYDELSYYTLAHPDPSFIHQHIVDAFAAQTANEHTKPIKIMFALVGLYLYLEKNYSGKQVQLTHMKLARHKVEWPRLVLPETRGALTVVDVLHAAPGTERDLLIHRWCVSVWDAYFDSQKQIVDILNKHFLNKEGTDIEYRRKKYG